METFESSDGTVIAYERSGNGAALVLVGGALTDHSATLDLVRLLAPRFTVYSYDRRGRGSSSDTPPYSVDLEVEDIEELIARTGGPAMVVGLGSGAVLALVRRSRRGGHDRCRRLRTALHRGRQPSASTRRPRGAHPGHGRERATRRRGRALPDRGGGALTVGGRPAARGGRRWAAMEAVASTITHDLTILGDCTIPTDRFERITIPVAILDNAASPQWLRGAARSVAAVDPGRAIHDPGRTDRGLRRRHRGARAHRAPRLTQVTRAFRSD